MESAGNDDERNVVELNTLGGIKHQNVVRYTVPQNPQDIKTRYSDLVNRVSVIEQRMTALSKDPYYAGKLP